jgi:hypothetical protein
MGKFCEKIRQKRVREAAGIRQGLGSHIKVVRFPNPPGRPGLGRLGALLQVAKV